MAKFSREQVTIPTIKVIGIGLTVSSTDNFLTISVDTLGVDTTMNLIPVTLGATQPAQQDIHVTLIANNTLVDDYNFANTDTTVTPTHPHPTGVVTHYNIPPSNVFTILNDGVVTIPKGSYTGYLQIKFIPNDFFLKGYAVGYTISSVAEAGYTISGNLNNGIVAIAIKNKFDGKYALTINTIGWAGYGIADNAPKLWPSALSLVTSGPNSVTFSTGEEGSFNLLLQQVAELQVLELLHLNSLLMVLLIV